ncbi:phage tail protein [Superficieibacter electus]|uniref:Phage tail protein n=1 Tax=Superficieibacter electus TaxID=2022662 RepID=A0A2P5GI14_9ENTR|nr:MULTISPECIES: tail assembly protein [Superficieibacter]POP41733.1 phage tail protein [Superficieibacter electus]POP42545.1 phage tail protein [Superficieibacter electus]WES69166.1 tail assembly protein [Superficieibacter sp. HKU1]
MQEVMTRIELGGSLGKTFGKVHHRLISTVHEAGRALSCTINGFESYMSNSQKRGLTYAIFKGKKNIGFDDLDYPVSGDVIRIVPLIIGSKRAGMLQTILGAVIVAVGAVLNFTPFAAASPYLYQIGGAMALGGVIQMLSPQPAGLASKQDPDNRASYAFGSVTNTTAQGYPVPLGYGKRRIGGAVLSAGIYVEDQQ